VAAVWDHGRVSMPSREASLRTPRRRAVDTGRRDEILQRATSVLLEEGFTSITVDDLARRLRCSKATLYSVASTKEQLVVAATKRFFEQATRHIEVEVGGISDPAARISAYLKGVGSAMSRQSSAFYRDMVSYPPTAEIYDVNSLAAARRVQELIHEGVKSGRFRDMDATFAGHLIAFAIEGIQSGRLQEVSGLSAGQAYVELGDLLVRGLGKNSA
jgi:AcrR family transcriptional regulator